MLIAAYKYRFASNPARLSVVDMAELPFSSRRRNNYAGSGRRIYATPNDLQSEMQVQDWAAKPAPWEGHRRSRDNRRQAGIGRGLQEEEEEQVRIKSDDRQEAGIEIRRQSSKHATGKGYVSPDQSEDIRKAASLLLASAGGVLFAGLCESCSTTLHDRLTSIASGEGVSALSTDSFTNCVPAIYDRWSGCSNGTLGTEGLLPNSHTHDLVFGKAPLSETDVDKHHTEGTASVESSSANTVAENAGRQEAVAKSDDGSRQAFRQDPTVEMKRGSVATGFNDNAANLIIKSALNTIRNTPAYRTRSVSRQAGLLQTPDQNSESANDSRESARILEVKRKKDFCLYERVNGQAVNILEGLELHSNVFDGVEQKELIEYIYELQELGRNQKLRKRTYSEPRKWMRGKGRVTIQFGCCYNYAVDKDGNPPGIIRQEEVDDIPPKLRMVIKRLVQWQVLPPSCIPDSCIVNIYDVGDCIPPHIDHHDFFRPFCTLSLLSECNIIFGTNLKIVGPGEFKGSISIPLPTGSVLILNGNGADVAKHAVPAVPAQRISITFRKMDPTKVPYAFRPDKELLSTEPLMNETMPKSKTAASVPNSADDPQAKSRTTEVSQFSLETDFPALGGPVSDRRHRNLRS